MLDIRNIITYFIWRYVPCVCKYETCRMWLIYNLLNVNYIIPLFKGILGLTQFVLHQELHLAEAVVNRMQTVGLRFCGAADQALPRLRGALPSGIVSNDI